MSNYKIDFKCLKYFVTAWSALIGFLMCAQTVNEPPWMVGERRWLKRPKTEWSFDFDRKVSCFGQEKWLIVFRIMCRTCFKGKYGQLYFSWTFSLTCLEALYWSTFKRQIWSRFEVRCWTKNVFQRIFKKMIQIIQKGNFGLISFFESGPKLPFGTILKRTKLAFWHVIINCDQN